MKLGFMGLGKMGLPMVERLIAGGHEVVVFDPQADAAQRAVAAGASAADSLAALVDGLNPAIIWLMIPAGLVEAQLAELYPLLKPASIVVDGGNSDFRETLQRGKAAAEHQITLVDVGTSGGVLGSGHGYSLMVGGPDAEIATLTPLFTALAPPDGWQRVGPAGAGHYVKMVHNAIEYGLMESYAEGYHMLKEGPIAGLDLAKIGGLWQHGSIISSLLNGLTAEALAENPGLEGIEGVVAESGETRWTLEIAKEKGIELPTIQAALEVRLKSEQGQTSYATKLLAAMRNKFGGHPLNIKK
ncbi:MAG TPA: NADP-dependent phosphogluconate dehydrogenase [Candidatus Saccharimonadales bacterium]|nr:NADP-dependent phosphogluconate dehydrogenase [Candidatus Saccharimonadales bacterium]